MDQTSAAVSAHVKVRGESRGHCDRGGVAKSEVVEAEYQALPGDAERLPDILKWTRNHSSLNLQL